MAWPSASVTCSKCGEVVRMTKMTPISGAWLYACTMVRSWLISSVVRLPRSTGLKAWLGFITVPSNCWDAASSLPSRMPTSDRRSTPIPMAPPDGETMPTPSAAHRPNRARIAASCSIPSGSSTIVTPVASHSASSAR
ncbi:Uncharacterised protein [Bordetella pertussis]|nr:Uncharacterised protein [Bordetella pertussis]